MIPLRDTNPTERTPFVAWAFIALNIAAFALWQPHGAPSPEEATTPAEQQEFIDEIGFTFCHGAIPAELTSFEPAPDIDGLGDTEQEQIAQELIRRQCPDKSVIASLFTSMFMHAGILHIVGNMLFLWIFGNNVEDRMGHGWFLLFYLAAGVVATYAHVVTSPGSAIPLVGASGAIAGVLGAYIVIFPHARVLTLVMFYFITMIELPALVVLGLWFVLQAFQGVGSLGVDVGGVAWFAHIGGFVFGAAVAWLFFRRPARPDVQEVWGY